MVDPALKTLNLAFLRKITLVLPKIEGGLSQCFSWHQFVQVCFYLEFFSQQVLTKMLISLKSQCPQPNLHFGMFLRSFFIILATKVSDPLFFLSEYFQLNALIVSVKWAKNDSKNPGSPWQTRFHTFPTTNI